MLFGAFYLVCFQNVWAQDGNMLSALKEAYPIGEPATISFRTPFIPSERMVFDAAPIVRYSFFNTIRRSLLDRKPPGFGIYTVFKPHLRLYDDASYPVRTPSYKIQLGGQYLWPVGNNDFMAVALESGHYSNGQDGCAFAVGIKDGTAASDSVYQTLNTNSDLSLLLNRSSGNFSTNLTEVHLNYRMSRTPVNRIPRHSASFRLGLIYYHNLFLGLLDFGGYTKEDIRIYGNCRWQAEVSYTRYFPQKKHPLFLTIGQQITLITGSDYKSINPWRSETTVAVYPWNDILGFGIFASYIAGHDNYNYRFVDNGSQLAVGICWSPFLSSKIAALPQ